MHIETIEAGGIVVTLSEADARTLALACATTERELSGCQPAVALPQAADEREHLAQTFQALAVALEAAGFAADTLGRLPLDEADTLAAYRTAGPGPRA